MHGELDEEVYIRAPPGVGLNGKIWKPDKAGYGLRQAARAWNCKLSEEMKTLGFKQCHSDPCLFIRGEGKDKVYALFHVDDAIVVGTEENIARTVDAIEGVFKIKRLGKVKYFLGIEVLHSPHGYAVTQRPTATRY